MEIRVVFADSQSDLPEETRRVLSEFPMITVVDSVCDSRSLSALLDRSACDVLVTECSMPGGDAYRDGIDLFTTIREKYPQLKIVLHTLIDNPAVIGKMVALGVSCVVSKQDEPSNIVSAIFAAATGGRYLSSNALSAMHYVEGQSPFWRACHLSHREIEVMRFYMNGLSVSEIARRFGRSIKTISSQKSSAMKKLGIGREIDLYRYGRAHAF
jgi:two-component system capsular synthesis response regulator RcsB